MTIIAGETNVRRARLIALKYALKLEISGMRKTGRSAYAIIKEEFGFTGNKQKVYDQFVAHIEALP